jgi:hypothetical protein
MAEHRAKFRRPTLDQALLLVLLLIASTMDGLGGLKFGGISGAGAATLVSAGAIWIVWLSQPTLPNGVLLTLMPLIFFEIDCAGTLLWFRPDQGGIQLLVVVLSFLALTMLTARVTAQTPGFAKVLLRAMVWLSFISVGLYAGKLAVVGASQDGIVGDRSFALGELAIVGILLAFWRSHSWPEPVRGEPRPRRAHWLVQQLPVVWAMIIVGLILLSLSRTALVIALLLFPLAVAFRGNTRSLLRSVLMLAIGATIFAAAVYSYQPLYNRFFHEDAAVKVGGVAINSSGRTKVWELLLTTLGDDWIFGKGVSSSEAIITWKFKTIGQPHNDYLRFYYDEGIVGVSLWLIFLIAMIQRLASNLRRSIIGRSEDYTIHLTALLALVGISLSMLTDNSVCYPFVMMPLAILLGCSLGVDAVHHSPMHAADERELSSLQVYG